MAPRPSRRLLVWLAAATLLAATAVAATVPRGPTLDWPESGVAVLPGGPEEVVDCVLAAMASGDVETAAGYAVSWAEPTYVAETMAAGLEQMGGLRRWLIVETLPGEPVVCKVYLGFGRAGDWIMYAELYPEPEGWRFANLHAAPNWQAPAWETAVTARVAIHSWPGHKSDLDLLAERAEEGYDKALGPLLAAGFAGLSKPIPVFVYDSQTSMAAATGTEQISWVIGRFHGDAVHLVSPAGVPGRQFDLCQVYVHELNHGLLAHYIAQSSGRQIALPAWLSEGLAGFAAGQLSGSRREGFARSIGSRTLPALSELADTFTKNPIEYAHEYSFSVAEYLTITFGRDALVKLVDGICRGSSADSVIPAVFGAKTAEIEAGWHAWLRRMAS